MPPRLTQALTLIALLALLALLASQSRAAEPATLYMPLLSCPSCVGPTPTLTPGAVGAERLELIRLVNEARLAAGCPAARVNDALMRGAQAWSVYMDTNSVYHHAPMGWYATYGFANGALENIGGGTVPHNVFTAWMASPAHKDNMLDCYFHNPSDPSYDPSVVYELGVGHSNGYWTLALGATVP